jgi:hypothetical protein
MASISCTLFDDETTNVLSQAMRRCTAITNTARVAGPCPARHEDACVAPTFLLNKPLQ